jgi:hypothetical protein
MGFLDKAKKMAEQAQTKLDDAQKQFNERQGGGQQSGGPAVEYDSAGRPIQRDEPAAPATPGQAPTPPHGDPLAGPGAPAAPAPTAPTPDPAAPAAPPVPPAPPSGDAALKPPTDEDPNKPSYEAPKLSGGDPLAG